MEYREIGQSLMASSLLCWAFSSVANVENANFDSWTGNVSNGWTTIVSGISVSSHSGIVKSGSYSAQIVVNTGSQSNTDLRQSDALEAGQTYTFSTCIYHTEVGVKTRLFVDGYQNYSNQELSQQWQQISYQYTSASNKFIDVGLRFYDVSGFAGNEIVYVDDFLPTSGQTTPLLNEGCNDYELNLSLLTDNCGEETSWQIRDSLDSTASSGSGYASNTQYTENICVTAGDYTFTISDRYGEGICCSYGDGSYTLSIGQKVLVSGGSFQLSEITPFTIGYGSGTDPITPPTDPSGYYVTTQGLTGYALKTELHNIIKTHISQGYSAIWGFYDIASRDKYYENDNSILDMYSENSAAKDSYNYVALTIV
jgi:hypothetical protein